MGKGGMMKEVAANRAQLSVKVRALDGGMKKERGDFYR